MAGRFMSVKPMTLSGIEPAVPQPTAPPRSSVAVVVVVVVVVVVLTGVSRGNRLPLNLSVW
jgi:hypothetical protein